MSEMILTGRKKNPKNNKNNNYRKFPKYWDTQKICSITLNFNYVALP